MDNKFNDALEPLLRSITKEENRNARGTMVYALQELDCTDKLKELFDILFTATKNAEVQAGILTVLDEQEFEFTKGNDDVLFLVDNEKFAVVHLTWASQRQTDDRWPTTQLFDNCDDLFHERILKDKEEFK